MKQILLAIGLTIIPSICLAVTPDYAFDGINFQIGVGGAQTQNTASGTEDTTLTPHPHINGMNSGTNFNGIVSLGYSQSLDRAFEGFFNEEFFKGFNLAANVFYIGGNQVAGNANNTTTANSGVVETLTGTYKLQNTWGVSLEPGYYFSPGVLGYFKLAYVGSTLNARFTCQSTDNACRSPSGAQGNTSSFSRSDSIQGIGLGFGTKFAITEHIYGGIDFLHVNYGSPFTKSMQNINWILEGTAANAHFGQVQTMGFASVGYRF